MSASSVRAAKDVISGFFNFEIDEGYFSAVNPALGSSRNLGIKKESSEEIATFTPDEANAVLDEIKGYRKRLYPMFLILFRAGLRLGECLALDFEDLNFQQGYISVTKSFKNGILGKTRKVDMSDGLRFTLIAYRTSTGPLAIKQGKSEISCPMFLGLNGESWDQVPENSFLSAYFC